MKTLALGVLSFIITVAFATAPLGTALAHGEPVITVEPPIVAAGAQIDVTGIEMEPGEVFIITLEGLPGSIPLGNASVTGEGDEGGFTATFTIPSDAVPGSYTVRAVTEEGEAATADLTVTAPSQQASAAPAMAQEPTGELHQIDRSKPIAQIIAVVTVIAISVAGGFLLIRSRA